jgi:hypothetical protein
MALIMIGTERWIVKTLIAGITLLVPAVRSAKILKLPVMTVEITIAMVTRTALTLIVQAIAPACVHPREDHAQLTAIAALIDVKEKSVGDGN